jgi:hypothetical protein
MMLTDRVAIHEAGHAVAFMALCPHGQVDITHNMVRSTEPLARSGGTLGYSTLVGSSLHRADLAIVAVAGWASEQVATQVLRGIPIDQVDTVITASHLTPDELGAADYAVAMEYAASLTSNARKALELVHRHWRAVTSIAGLLSANGVVSARDTRRIFEWDASTQRSHAITT